MKRTILLLSTVAFTGLSLFSFKGEKSDKGGLSINTKVSSIEWIGKKVSGEHKGGISIKEGSIHLKDGLINHGEVVIDMNSITNTDMEGEWSEKLVGHLNSGDFFDVKNHPAATLEITSSKKLDGNKQQVTGKLTIKNITHPIEFPATIELKGGKLASYAEVKVDRTLYDIKYGSGKFFEGLGDKMIDDEFTIKFKIAAE